MPNPGKSFGPFRFDLTSGLSQNDVPIVLGGRATAILSAMIERPGELITASALFHRAWPDGGVNQNNLKVQISRLRKALGAHGKYIRTEASLGYRFTGFVNSSETSIVSCSRAGLVVPRNLVAPIGRTEAIDEIVALIRQHRLVTVAGPGGIGKTTIAREVATGSSDAFQDGIAFVDCARARTSVEVFESILGTLDLPVTDTPTSAHVVGALRNRHLLLVMDTCEHIIDTVALLAECLIAVSQSVNILVVSREILKLSDEIVRRIDALPFPDADCSMTAGQVSHFSSIQLFQRHALQADRNFCVTDANASLLATICHRLEGVPLAIELVASMVGTIGLSELTSSLQERNCLLSLGGNERQRSVHATIAWSFSLLSSVDQNILLALACFAGSFSLREAMLVASDGAVPRADVRRAIISLSDKSLLKVDHQDAAPVYRLLDMTRAYLLQISPAARGYAVEAARERHSRYVIDRLENETWDEEELLADRQAMRSCLMEVKAALEWSLIQRQDLAVRLLISSERLWLELTWLPQYRQYLDIVLERMNSGSVCKISSKAALAVARVCIQAQVMTPGPDENAFYEEACQLAKDSRDDFLHMRAIFAMLCYKLRCRQAVSPWDLRILATVAGRFDEAMRDLPLVISAFSNLEASNIEAAHAGFRRFLDQAVHLSRKYRSFFIRNLMMRCEVAFAVTVGLLESVTRANELMRTIVDAAFHRADPTTICYVLAHGAIPCAMLGADVELASEYVGKLEKLAQAYDPWKTLADGYRAVVTAELCRQKSDEDSLRVAECILDAAVRDVDFLKSQGKILATFLFEAAEIKLRLGDLDAAERLLLEAYYCRFDDHDAQVIGRHARISAKLRLRRNNPIDLAQARAELKSARRLLRRRKLLLEAFDVSMNLVYVDLSLGNYSLAKSEARRLLRSIPDDAPEFKRAAAKSLAAFASSQMKTNLSNIDPLVLGNSSSISNVRLPYPQ